MSGSLSIIPIGRLKKDDETIKIEIYEEYKDALLGLEEFSHIIVFFWFHVNDNPDKRNVFQVHPQGNETNPLTGVFATRSAVRPNPIDVSLCKIRMISDNIIYIYKTDAFDGTPVIDIKPYIPDIDSIFDVRIPEWAKK